MQIPLIKERFWLILAAIALLLALGGCGGDDSNADSPASSQTSDEVTLAVTSLPKKEFAQQATEICREARAKFDREFGAFRKSDDGRSLMSEENADEGEAEEMMDTIFIPTYQAMADELTALGAPRAELEDVAAFIEAVERTLQRAEDDALATFEGGSPFLEAGNLGPAAGLSNCSFALT